jgi:hypothetical protein
MKKPKSVSTAKGGVPGKFEDFGLSFGSIVERQTSFR